MTPDQLTQARERLGLTAAALGRRLELEGRDPGQQVKRWEAAKAAIPGPVRVAIRYMLADLDAPEHVAHAVAQALQEDRQRRAAEDMPPVPRAMTELMTIPRPNRSRRRG